MGINDGVFDCFVDADVLFAAIGSKRTGNFDFMLRESLV